MNLLCNGVADPAMANVITRMSETTGARGYQIHELPG
jgi:hypothetical protein